MSIFGPHPNAPAFGSLKVDYTSDKPMSDMTLSKVARIEWDAVEAIIRKALRSDTMAIAAIEQ